MQILEIESSTSGLVTALSTSAAAAFYDSLLNAYVNPFLTEADNITFLKKYVNGDYTRYAYLVDGFSNIALFTETVATNSSYAQCYIGVCKMTDIESTSYLFRTPTLIGQRGTSNASIDGTRYYWYINSYSKMRKMMTVQNIKSFMLDNTATNCLNQAICFAKDNFNRPLVILVGGSTGGNVISNCYYDNDTSVACTVGDNTNYNYSEDGKVYFENLKILKNNILQGIVSDPMRVFNNALGTNTTGVSYNLISADNKRYRQYFGKHWGIEDE